ncbi:uncharacterized protein LOC111255142 [Varroa destructor]|uniref:Uncharacterized protein n=2 Tax=Varroa TaxID=62624 RepID=A0A7M7MJT2_VARDE|nr:uncharacterized protein LOC111255142 [Varroa destructor]
MLVALLEFCYKSRLEATRSKTTMYNAMKAKVRMSITGTQNGTGPSGGGNVAGGVGVQGLAEDRIRFHNPGPHLINPEFLDDRISVNTHTQIANITIPMKLCHAKETEINV